MNNFTIKLKKMFSNKNFVTAFCFVLIAIVLIFGYNYRLKEATKPIKVPYALKTIEPQTRITEDMIGYMSIAREAVKDQYIYTRVKDIEGLYTNLDSTIYAGSFFYKDSILKKEQLPTEPLLDIPNGETLLTLSVNSETTYYNIIHPGDYIDIYVRTIGILPNEKNKDKEIIVGKLLDKIKILGVKTKDGDNVFGSDEKREPAGLLFALPEEYALLLMKASYFSELAQVANNGVQPIEFVVVPRGNKYEPKEGETVTATLTSEQLQDYINAKTKDVDVNEIKNNKIGG